MPTPGLVGGIPIGLEANVAYGIPTGPYRLLSSGAITFSTTEGGVFAALTGADAEPGVLVSGGFVKVIAPRIVILKKISNISNAYAAVAARSNPIALWRFNEQSGSILYDSMGTGNLTKGSGVTLAAAGPLGDGSLAITTDGTVNGIAVTASGVNLWSGATALSFEAWIKNPAFGVGHEILVSLGTQGIYLSANSGKIFMSIHIGSQFTTTAVPSLPVDTWTHVVGTWESGDRLRLYVDGAEVAVTDNTVRSGAISSSPNYFVGCLGPNLLPWSGSLANVAVYLRKLTASEVSRHYGARMGL